jgi:hypothetical protein
MADSAPPVVDASLLNIFQNTVPLNQQNQAAVNELRARAAAHALQHPVREDTDDDFMAAAGEAISETDRPRRSNDSDKSSSSASDQEKHSDEDKNGSDDEPSRRESRRDESRRDESRRDESRRDESRRHDNSARRRRNNIRNTRGFRTACAAIVNRHKLAAADGPIKVARTYVADPDEAERREIRMQLDELCIGAKLNIERRADMSTAEMTYLLERYTTMLSRDNDVTLALNVMCKIADTIEALNRASGPWLPLDGYGNTVRAATNEPQFRYAVYRLLLKYRGSNSFSPVRVVAIALLLPLFQAVVDALLSWAARGNAALEKVSSQVQGAAHAAITFAVGSNPEAHIPTTAPDVIFPHGRPAPTHPVFAHDEALDGPLMTGPQNDDDDDLIDALAGVQPVQYEYRNFAIQGGEK